MHVPMALGRFLPTDTGYMPFGLPWLRGLNVLTLGLVALIGLLLGLYNTFHMVSRPAVLPPADFLVFAILRGPIRTLILFMPMVLLVTAASHLGEQSKTATRVGLLAAAVLLGALIQGFVGYPVVCLVDFLAGDEPDDPECTPSFTLSWGKLAMFSRAVVWGSLLTAVLYFYKRERDAALTLHLAQMRRLDAERQETDARLLSLQAQIEPHFLFNTLAHVQRLYEVQPERGRAMLSNLVAYLQSALPQMRRPESTVAAELALARAYLNVQQLRMGDRLQFEVDVPDALAGAALPPLMLVTLVENAIKHGLSPKLAGGTVRIVARAASGRLQVEVHDDGVGLKIGAGTGRGLANTRARLAAQFGRGGALDIGSGPAGGVRATLELPFALVPQEAAVA